MASPVQPVPNYTTPALVMGFINLMWILLTVCIVWGLPTVLVLAVVLNAGINWIGRRKGTYRPTSKNA